MTKPLRLAMPFTTAIIDDFRAHWPEAGVVEAVKAGIDGQPVFHARENGYQIGTPLPSVEGKSISMADIDLHPASSLAGHHAGRTKGK